MSPRCNRETRLTVAPAGLSLLLLALALTGCRVSGEDPARLSEACDVAATHAAPTPQDMVPVGAPLVDVWAEEIAAWTPGQPSDFAWQPNSDIVAFLLHTWQHVRSPEGSERTELRLFDTISGTMRTVLRADGSSLGYPTWSEDGSRLYFLQRFRERSAEEGVHTWWQVCAADLDGQDVATLGITQVALWGTGGETPLPDEAVILPKRHKVIVSARSGEPSRAGVSQSLFVYDWRSEEVRELRTPAAAPESRQPGREVARREFRDLRRDREASRVLCADGGAVCGLDTDDLCDGVISPRVLFQHDGEVVSPAGRPGTTQISYLRYDAGNNGLGFLYLRDMDTGQDVPVLPAEDRAALRWAAPTYSSHWHSSYTWSPDGQRLIFCIYSAVWVLKVPPATQE